MPATEISAEVITIGDEILIGQILDTNSAWIGTHLNDMGIWLSRIVSIGDNAEDIRRALKSAGNRANVVFITGGLGPTRDDITKSVLAEYFNTDLVSDAGTMVLLEGFAIRRGIVMNELNVKQAEVLRTCTVIPNFNGTAPGMWMEKDGVIYISMPGVPYEMEAMMEESVLPMLRKCFDLPFIRHKKFITSGIGESDLALLLEKWETGLPSCIRLAYLPSPGWVKLRLTAKGSDLSEIETELHKAAEGLKSAAGKYLLGEDAENPEALIASYMSEKGFTVSTAESCTGGYIAHCFTRQPGASLWFKGGIIAYDNTVKKELLDVPESVLINNGAVSRQTVEQMAVSVKQKMYTDFAIATSGIIGPSGGTEYKPVGMVWIAVATPGGVLSGEFMFGNDRMRNITKASLSAMNMLINSFSDGN